MEQKIVIGKIVAPHGVRGEFRVLPLTDQPEQYEDRETLTLDNGRVLHVVSVRFHKNAYLVKVQEVTDMDQAEACGAGPLS